MPDQAEIFDRLRRRRYWVPKHLLHPRIFMLTREPALCYRLIPNG